MEERVRESTTQPKRKKKSSGLMPPLSAGLWRFCGPTAADCISSSQPLFVPPLSKITTEALNDEGRSTLHSEYRMLWNVVQNRCLFGQEIQYLHYLSAKIFWRKYLDWNLFKTDLIFILFILQPVWAVYSSGREGVMPCLRDLFMQGA